MTMYSVFLDKDDDTVQLGNFDLFEEAKKYLIRTYRIDFSKPVRAIMEDDYFAGEFQVKNKTIALAIEWDD